MNEIDLKTAKRQDWDLIIVGSGVGGSAVASSATEKQKKVLLVTPVPSIPTESTWTQFVHDNRTGKNVQPFLGDGLGGSSQFFGMVMERLDSPDFISNGGAWPGLEKEWETDFAISEKLYQVTSGRNLEAFGAVHDRLQKAGFRIRETKLACRQVSGCQFCQGRNCPKACKVDASQGPLQKAHASGNLFVLNARVSGFVLQGDRVIEAKCDGPMGQGKVRAQNFVLAAGALRTPGILKNSENSIQAQDFTRLPAIGHYFMRHLVDLYALDWPALRELSKDQISELARAKSWSSETFYSGDGKKLGLIQAFGSLPDFRFVWREVLQMWPALQWIPFAQPIVKQIICQIFNHPIAATIVEDEPSFQNHVQENGRGQLDVHYRMSMADQTRLNAMRAAVKNALGPLLYKFLPEAENNFRLAHACGTCRMGLNEKDSVVDGSGRVHRSENLWIADASVFPSSTTKNPANIISAVALRTVRQMYGNL